MDGPQEMAEKNEEKSGEFFFIDTYWEEITRLSNVWNDVEVFDGPSDVLGSLM